MLRGTSPGSRCFHAYFDALRHVGMMIEAQRLRLPDGEALARNDLKVESLARFAGMFGHDTGIRPAELDETWAQRVA